MCASTNVVSHHNLFDFFLPRLELVLKHISTSDLIPKDALEHSAHGLLLVCVKDLLSQKLQQEHKSSDDRKSGDDGAQDNVDGRIDVSF